MMHIRKYMTSLAAAGFVMAVSVPAHAAFETRGTATLSASATTGGAPVISIVSATIKNRSNNATTTTIGWTGALPGAGWLVSNQYVHLVTNITTGNGGVQYYTDNTNAAASPRFPPAAVSTFTATPAGLVDNVDPTQKLPTAWRASTFTLTAVNPIDPNANGGESFLWFFHEDHAQVAVPSLNAAAFVNADPFVTLYAAPGTVLTGQSTPVSGLHFAQSPTEFGGFQSNANTYIYTQADFTGALAARTYSTNRLILEAFAL